MSPALETLDTKVVKLISQVVPVKPADIKPEHRLREDLGMDSVASMELLSAMAEELDLDVGVEDVADVKTVAAVVELAKRFVAAKVA